MGFRFVPAFVSLNDRNAPYAMYRKIVSSL